MSDGPAELLVVIEPSRYDDAVAGLRDVAEVTQVLPPRLALVRGDEGVAGRAARIDGVAAVHEDDLPEAGDLLPTERAFAAAWHARRRSKARRGEGASWDAPGFTPPDAPGRQGP